MGLLQASIMRQRQAGQALPAETFAALPSFTQGMAQTGQMQPGMPTQGAPAFGPQQSHDAQYAQLLQFDPAYGSRLAALVQGAFPQKRPSHLLGGGN